MTALGTILETHGLPQALYTDRAGWAFYTPKTGEPVDRDKLTQVGRALARLGIEHIPAYSPQARGRAANASTAPSRGASSMSSASPASAPSPPPIGICASSSSRPTTAASPDRPRIRPRPLSRSGAWTSPTSSVTKRSAPWGRTTPSPSRVSDCKLTSSRAAAPARDCASSCAAISMASTASGSAPGASATTMPGAGATRLPSRHDPFPLTAVRSRVKPARSIHLLTTYEKPFSARQAAYEVAEVGDDQVGVRGAGPAGGGVVDTAHPRALRSPHVGDGIVADVGRFARVYTELRQGSPEDLGVGLAVADLVRIRDRPEVAQEVVPFQDPSQDDAGGAAGIGDDAERDTARGELTHRVLGPGLQVGRQPEHRLDVAGDGLLEESGGHGVPRPRRRRLEHEAHLLGDRWIAVPTPEALDQHVLRPVVGVHHVGQAEHAAGAAENPVERADAEQPLVAHILRRVMDERFPEIESDGAEHEPTRTWAGASRGRPARLRAPRPSCSFGRRH